MSLFDKIHLRGITEKPTKAGPLYSVIEDVKPGYFIEGSFLRSKWLGFYAITLTVWFYIVIFVVTLSNASGIVKYPGCSILCNDP